MTEIKIHRKSNIKSHVPTLGWPIAPSRFFLQISGGVYGHTIVTVLATRFLFTVLITLRDFTTLIKYHTYYLGWQTTTIVFYILAIYSNMEGIITLTFIMMKKIGCPVGSSLMPLWRKIDMQVS